MPVVFAFAALAALAAAATGLDAGPAAGLDVEALYRRYGPMVLRRCRSLLRDEGEAQDALQETFVRVLRSEDRLDGRAPSALLYQVATRICLNVLRGRRRRVAVHDVGEVDDAAALLDRIAVAGEPGARHSAFQMLDRLFRGELDSTRTLAVLHLHDGLTLEEVALHCGLSVSGVRKRLARLRASLSELEALP